MVSHADEQDDTLDDTNDIAFVAPTSTMARATQHLKAQTTSYQLAKLVELTNANGPDGYIQARNQAKTFKTKPELDPHDQIDLSCDAEKFMRAVEHRPYFPLLKVDIADEASVLRVAKIIHSCREALGASPPMSASDVAREMCKFDDANGKNMERMEGKVTRISGGLTNALFLVQFPMSQKTKLSITSASDETNVSNVSVLVRVFGAEGMIDRDEETTTFARLCDAGNNGNGSTCGKSVIHPEIDLLGRFANGRIESWIHNLRQAHHLNDFGCNLARGVNADNGETSGSEGNGWCSGSGGVTLEVARQMARLHYGFDIPQYLLHGASEGVGNLKSSPKQTELEPTLWKVICSWINELSTAISQENFQKNRDVMQLFQEVTSGVITSKDESDDDKECNSKATDSTACSSPTSNLTTAQMAKDIIASFNEEKIWLQSYNNAKHPEAYVAFCHNDVNAPNILLDASIPHVVDTTTNNIINVSHKQFNEKSVCIIDFEYGSINYTMFDVANFFNEHCGGLDDGVPNYGLYPSLERQVEFLTEYVKKRDEILGGKCDDTRNGGERDIAQLQSQVDFFRMVNNLYWGIWGIVQASEEVNLGTFVMETARLRVDGAEGMDSFDYLRYGKKRLDQYRVCKERILGGSK